MRNNSSPSWYVSLVPVIFLVCMMFLVIKFFGADALDGASQVALVLASGLTIGISMGVYGKPWKELESAIGENIKNIGSALVILLLIGSISGTWMISGIVPTFICYGLKVIYPGIFLFAVCIICTLVSLMTGSSWTTVATIGVAMIAIGSALGYSAAWTAGAVISGAYFGDKISPLSDTTILASSSAQTPLFDHIRYMMITTVPSFIITLVIFLVVSICHQSPSVAQVDDAVLALKSVFKISPWLLIVPAVTAVLIVKKVPAILTLLSASVMGAVLAVIAQPQNIVAISGSDAFSFEACFRGVLVSCFGSTGLDCGNEVFNSLITTRGMNGMLPTVFLIICAATFGGTLTGSGFVHSLTSMLTSHVSSRTGLVGATVGTGLFSNMATGDQYLSIILTCSLYKKLYGDKGYENRLLSRSVEDSATVTSVLIPWNSCGMTQSTVLHIPTLEYLPYCFFNIISPLMSILVASLGYKIFKQIDSVAEFSGNP